MESQPALVVHASTHGSTQAVAEAVAATLTERGIAAEVRPAREVREPLRGRRLVVVGGAIYRGRWHRDAHRFLKRHREELLHVPVAVFGMGPREDTDEAWRRAGAQLDRALAKRGWLMPVSVRLFGGVDPSAKKNQPRRDARDWDVIRSWAAELARLAAPVNG